MPASSSACTRAFRCIRAASASSRAITARRRATWACRSSLSACCIGTAISVRSSTPTAARSRTITSPTSPTCRSRPARGADGAELRVQVPIAERDVQVKIWRAKCGHIDLYLLDTDLPENSDADRRISYQLYGGDETTRIQQEIVLGIGGVRARARARLDPTVWHINEGHAAFQILERCREQVSAGPRLRVCAGGGRGRHRVHDAHAGAGRARRVQSQPHARCFERFARELGLSMDAFLALGASPVGTTNST